MGHSLSNEQTKEENRISNKKLQDEVISKTKLPLSELELLNIDELNKAIANIEKNDIDQKNRQLLKRWEAVQKVRLSYWEALIAKVF